MQLRLGENVKRSYYVQLILPGKGDHIPNLPNVFLQVSNALKCVVFNNISIHSKFQVKKYRNVINFTTESLLSFDHRCKEVRKEIEKYSAL